MVGREMIGAQVLGRGGSYSSALCGLLVVSFACEACKGGNASRSWLFMLLLGLKVLWLT